MTLAAKVLCQVAVANDQLSCSVDGFVVLGAYVAAW